MPSRRLLRSLVLLSILTVLASPPPGEATEPAGAWNDRGIRSFSAGNYAGAIRCFERALETRPGDETILFNLASSHGKLAIEAARTGDTLRAIFHARSAVEIEGAYPYFHKVLGYVYQRTGRLDEAYESFRAAASLDPQDAGTLALLGNVSYRLDEIDQAIGFWEESITLDPSQQKIGDRIERATRERVLEDGFRTIERGDFVVDYDPSIPDAENAAERLAHVLEEARREIAGTLGHRTAAPVPVVLYSPERFRAYMGGRAWTRGVYDGKIRLPQPAPAQDDRELRTLVTHEYVHAVVYELTDDRAPAWLNEGLAQVLAREWRSGSERIARGLGRDVPLVPLGSLEESFLRLPREQVEPAYVEAYLVVSHLLDRYTKRHLLRLFERLSEGAPAREAVREVYHVSGEELLERAMEDYRAKTVSRR